MSEPYVSGCMCAYCSSTTAEKVAAEAAKKVEEQVAISARLAGINKMHLPDSLFAVPTPENPQMYDTGAYFEAVLQSDGGYRITHHGVSSDAKQCPNNVTVPAFLVKRLISYGWRYATEEELAPYKAELDSL